SFLKLYLKSYNVINHYFSQFLMFDHIAQPVSYQHIAPPFLVHLDIKRLDLVHPQISGNKFFKLKYNLLVAKQQGLSSIL
ncbi:hypothetical protein NL379_30905, partial [Klebsiella pneumoniae]|nr:hypothetical protein [Klebsiella pneumoniae]